MSRRGDAAAEAQADALIRLADAAEQIGERLYELMQILPATETVERLIDVALERLEGEPVSPSPAADWSSHASPGHFAPPPYAAALDDLPPPPFGEEPTPPPGTDCTR